MCSISHGSGDVPRCDTRDLVACMRALDLTQAHVESVPARSQVRHQVLQFALVRVACSQLSGCEAQQVSGSVDTPRLVLR